MHLSTADKALLLDDLRATVRKQFGLPCYRRTGATVDWTPLPEERCPKCGMLVAHLPGIARLCDLTGEEYERRAELSGAPHLPTSRIKQGLLSGVPGVITS